MRPKRRPHRTLDWREERLHPSPHLIGRTARRDIHRTSRDTHARVVRHALGGDEFALLVEDLHDQAELDTVADRVHRLLAEPVRLPAQGEIVTAASIGTTVISADEPETVLARADAAMYADKITRRTARVPPPTGPDAASP